LLLIIVIVKLLQQDVLVTTTVQSTAVHMYQSSVLSCMPSINSIYKTECVAPGCHD
jgi:hypothetical protein